MRQALEGTGQQGLLRKIYRSEFNIDFVGRRKLWLGISGALVVVSVIALIPGVRGLSYGIDFRGGALFRVPLARTVSVADLKSTLGTAGLPAAQIQIATDNASKKKAAQIETEANVDQTKMLETSRRRRDARQTRSAWSPSERNGAPRSPRKAPARPDRLPHRRDPLHVLAARDQDGHIRVHRPPPRPAPSRPASTQSRAWRSRRPP